MFIDENCSHTTESLSSQQITEYLSHVPDWTYDSERNLLSRSFKFDQYALGPRFAVEIGKMADQQDHHPDMHIYYKKCVLDFTTHSAKGVSRNDFICATKADRIFSVFNG